MRLCLQSCLNVSPELQSNFHSRLWPHKNPFNCVASPAYHPHAPGCAHYHYHESRLWIRPASQVLWEPPFLGMTWSFHPRSRQVPTLGVMSCSHIPESAVSLQKLIPQHEQTCAGMCRNELEESQRNEMAIFFFLLCFYSSVEV